MQCFCQNLLEEGIGDHKYLKCPDIPNNMFEAPCSEIALDKVDLECEVTAKS